MKRSKAWTILLIAFLSFTVLWGVKDMKTEMDRIDKENFDKTVGSIGKLENAKDDETNISGENFEQRVDLGQTSEQLQQQTDDMFAEFFDERFEAEDGCRWSFIGGSYSTFVLEKYNFESFHVYRVDYPNGAKYYFLIPFNGYIGVAPNVYLFLENKNLLLVWIGNYYR